MRHAAMTIGRGSRPRSAMVSIGEAEMKFGWRNDPLWIAEMRLRQNMRREIQTNRMLEAHREKLREIDAKFAAAFKPDFKLPEDCQ